MDCPDIADVTDDTKKLSYTKKLKLLEKDAESLYEFCMKKRFSSAQVKNCITPMLGKKDPIMKRLKEGSTSSLFRLSITVGVIAILVAWPLARSMINVHLKLLSLKVIPYWDWTTLYNEDCLINNPYVEEQQTTEEDCYGCIDFGKATKEGDAEIDRMENANTTVITNDYLYGDWPFIIVDPVKNWPVDEDGQLLFSLHKIQDLYLTHDSLSEEKDFKDCEFFSTDENMKTVHDFIKTMDANKLPKKYNVAWDNCVPKAAKVFRLFTTRPYFLPAMAEASKSNQIIVAKGNFERDSFNIPQQIDSASWIVVLSGEMGITLVPKEECLQFKCKEETFVIGAGEAAVVPTRIWSVLYSPLAEDDVTLAFSSTVLWDDVV